MILRTLILSALVVFSTSATSYALLGDIFNKENERVAQLKSKTPYIVIRFNNRELKIKRQIYNAISQAVEIKPNLGLEVVNIIPEDNPPSKTLIAKGFVQIIRLLEDMGIPKENMSTYKGYDDVDYHEVRIYIK